jgi:hypothetical protein
MRILPFLLLSFTIGCKNRTENLRNIKPVNSHKSQTNTFQKGVNPIYLFLSDSIKIEFLYHRLDTLHIDFDIKVTKGNKFKHIKGVGELIRLEENSNFYLPEGTAIIDEANGQEYFCDSTFSYEGNTVSLGIGFEKNTKKRLSLTVNDSKSTLLQDHDYTLHAVFNETSQYNTKTKGFSQK